MTTLANKIVMPFEPSMAVDLSATGEKTSNAVYSPKLGAVSVLRYKPARVVYKLTNDATTASANIVIKAGGNTLATEAIDLSGSEAFGAFDVDLADLGGSTPIQFSVDVTGAGGGGETASITAHLEVEPISAVL